jgi:hypothetical protein
MRLTEEEKKKIIDKYVDDTSDDLLNHLKRRYPLHVADFEWTKEPIKTISIDSKQYWVKGNKKFLVNKLYGLCEDVWMHLGENKIRRTIKKFLDVYGS